MKKPQHISRFIATALTLIGLGGLTACSDHLFDDLVGNGEDDTQGMQFAISTHEMADLQVNVGSTRATTSATDPLRSQHEQADHYALHSLQGSNPYGLQVYRMPLPYVGIHQKTSETSETNPNSTRAAYSEVASTTYFHDSLTIWGYAYTDTEATPLFNGSLLKKIRGWRSSVQWPYGAGDHMQFYAISPAYESLNLSVTQPSFSTGTFTPPTFTYTLPEKAGEMRDLLYGTGYVESVEAGPAGSITANPKAENLGKDNKFIDLHFQHLLTAIRFAQGSIPSGITVKSITLKSIYTQGDYDPAADDADTGTPGTWDIDESSTKLSYTLATNFSGTGTGSANTYIDNNQVFLVIPHELTDEEAATLEIEIEAPQHYAVDENGIYTPLDGERVADESTHTTHTLTCPLKGDVWKKGYTVTYMLTIGQVADGYYLIAEQPEAFPHNDLGTTDGSFTLHSYRSYFDYKDTPLGTEDFSHDVQWKVTGYSIYDPATDTFADYGTEAPSWLSGLTRDSEQPGGYAISVPFTLAEQSYTKGGNHATILKENVATASNLDLSWYSPNAVGSGKESHKFASRQPANSYIVNRHGTYQFPAIYGNKTSDGPEADCFTDHTGTTISHSFIQDQLAAYPPILAYTNAGRTERTSTNYDWSSGYLRAVIVWQDVDGLIKSPSIAAGYNMLGFTVSSESPDPRPGNAVIALQGKKKITYQKYVENDETHEWEWVLDTNKGSFGYAMSSDDWETFWTWHIWVTDEVYPNDGNNNTYSLKHDATFLNYNSPNGDHIVTLQNAAGNTNTILPVNLGWVPNEMEFGYYSPRKVRVKLEQVDEVSTAENHQTTVVLIEQEARQPLTTGTSTVYQWGRPTALPMVKKMDGTTHTLYKGTAFSSETFTVENIADPQDIITHPTKLYRTSSDDGTWFSTSSTIPSRWGNGTTKTVYDPCPPGFYIPDYGIFKGFSLTGASSTDGNNLNMWKDAGQLGKGAYLYTTRNETNRYGQTVYMPATGLHSANHSAGTPLDATFTSTNAALVWGNGKSDGTKQGEALWMYPDWHSNDSDNPAIQLPLSVPFSTAIPVRPAGHLLNY